MMSEPPAGPPGDAPALSTTDLPVRATDGEPDGVAHGKRTRQGWARRFRLTVAVLGLVVNAAAATPLLFHQGRFDPGGLIFGLVLLVATAPALALYVGLVRSRVASVLVGVVLLLVITGPAGFMAGKVLASQGSFGVGLIAFAAPVLGLPVAAVGVLIDHLVRAGRPGPVAG